MPHFRPKKDLRPVISHKFLHVAAKREDRKGEVSGESEWYPRI